jgi:hypothetical protein
VPLQKLQFRAGVNREGTTLANEGGWYDCDKVRFRSGFPEKIGGWAALSYNTFLGTCRSLWNWVTLKSANLLGVGTNLKFYIENGGFYYDITPIQLNTTNTKMATYHPPKKQVSTYTKGKWSFGRISLPKPPSLSDGDDPFPRAIQEIPAQCRPVLRRPLALATIL